MIRGVRGATTVDENKEAAILDATVELLRSMIERNGIERRRCGQCPVHGHAGYHGRLSGQGGAHDRLDTHSADGLC